MFGHFKRCRNSGEILNFPSACLGIQPFHIPLFAFFQRSTYENFQKIILSDNIRRHFTDIIIRADKCRNRNDTAVQKQFGDFGDTTDVLHTVGFGEAQIVIDTAADIVAVQNTAKQSALMELALQCNRNRAFSRSAQTCKPDHHAVLSQKFFFVLPRHHAVKDRIYMILFFHL